MLGAKLALTARGIGIVGNLAYDKREKERLVLRLGPLYAPQVAFVTQARQRLAGVITGAVTGGALAQYVCVLAAATPFSPLDTPPASGALGQPPLSVWAWPLASLHHGS